MYLPFSHATQSSSLSLPVVGEYVPARQSTHVAAPVAPDTAEYFPVPQSAHVAADATEYLPASQSKHSAVDVEVAPGVEYVPALHAAPEHVEAPVVAEYLPGSHFEHSLAPPAEYSPASHG